MAYHHGVRILEAPTSIVAPVTGTAGLQVVFGTAPVNLAEDPYAVTNKPVIAYSFAEAVAQIGYSDDYKRYTLCQSIDATFRVLNVAPIILINVLDPAKHKKRNEQATVAVEDMQAKIPYLGVLSDKIKVFLPGHETVDVGAAEDEVSGDGPDLDALLDGDGDAAVTEPAVTDDTPTGELIQGTDFVVTFDDDGYAIINLYATGAGAEATSLVVDSTSIDPDAVTWKDIVGGYNVSTGQETGLELIRQIYPRFAMTPGLILAPGWSHIPNVAAVIGAKCVDINGMFSCECVLDVDTTQVRKYTDVLAWKNSNGYTNKRSALLWPMIKVGEKQYAYSAIFAALTAYIDVQNDDIPVQSPSNILISVTGTVLDDGTEVYLDKEQGNLLNSQGVITAINLTGWRTWGNRTAVYPAETDPKDMWFCCRRFFSWWGNSFILTYFQKVDRPMTRQLVENIIDQENIRGNSYVARNKCAGARIEYLEEENPITDIVNGKLAFHQYLAPWVPAEDIVNTLEFDPQMLQDALYGGE